VNEDRRYFLKVSMLLKCSLLKRWEIIRELSDHLKDARLDSAQELDVALVFGSASSLAKAYNRILIWEVRMRKSLFYFFLTMIIAWLGLVSYFKLSLPEFKPFPISYSELSEDAILGCEGSLYSQPLRQLGLFFKEFDECEGDGKPIRPKPQALSQELPAAIRYQYQGVTAHIQVTELKYKKFLKLLASCESNPNCRAGDHYMLVTIDEIHYPDPGVRKIEVAVERWDESGRVRSRTEHKQFTHGNESEIPFRLYGGIAITLILLWMSILLTFELWYLSSLVIKKIFFTAN
jgi:hypothetical protein